MDPEVGLEGFEGIEVCTLRDESGELSRSGGIFGCVRRGLGGERAWNSGVRKQLAIARTGGEWGTSDCLGADAQWKSACRARESLHRRAGKKVLARRGRETGAAPRAGIQIN
jgi:hypothetical protein